MKQSVKRKLVQAFLIMFLYAIHSKMLFYLNPDKVMKNGGYGQFSFTHIADENSAIAMLTAIAFSVITVFILNLFHPKHWMFWVVTPTFAVLDGVGVFLYFFPDLNTFKWFTNTAIENLVLFGAVYYGIYTSIFILSFGFHRYLTSSENALTQRGANVPGEMPSLENLVAQGLNQKEIAEKLNTSQSTVSRMLSRLDEKG